MIFKYFHMHMILEVVFEYSNKNYALLVTTKL